MTPLPRRLLAAGLACVVAALGLAGLRPLVLGRPLPMVHVTLKAIDPADRQSLEQRFRLSEPTPVDRTTWAYVPLDVTPATLGAIVTHPAVADTAGINRRDMTLGRRTPLTERRGGLWARPPARAARVTLAVAILIGIAGVLMLAGAAVQVGFSVEAARHVVRAAPARLRALAARLTIPVPLGAALILVVVAAFRMLALDFVDNDHFVSLTSARQVTLGELPVRDFDDPGLPLAIALSAAALWLGGSSLLPEVVLTSSMLALAAVVAWRAAARISGMPALALAATSLQVIAFPRLYSYPKILVNACAALAFIEYARRPTRLRLVGLATLTELALLFRYDLALYLALATVFLLVLVHGWTRTAAVRLSLYVGASVALTLPYALYLSAFGLGGHLESAMAFSQAEARRTIEWGAVLAQGQPLTLVVVFLPVVVCVWVIARRRRHGRWDDDAPAVAAIAVLLAVLDAVMLRDRTHARLADVFGPAPVLLAWAGARALRATAHAPTPARRGLGLSGLAALGLVIVSGTVRLGAFPHQLGEAGLTEGWAHFTDHARRQVTALGRWPWIGITQDGVVVEPLVRYLDACTARDDGVLVVGFVPQLPFLARRPFAGGHPAILPGYYTGGADQRRMEAWLVARPPAVVVIDSYDAPDIAAQWPAIARLLPRYRDPVVVGRFLVRVAGDRPATSVHAGTGLPCAR